jgi:hypothetical protein
MGRVNLRRGVSRKGAKGAKEDKKRRGKKRITLISPPLL